MANIDWQAELKDWLISIAIALVLAFFIRTYIIELYLVHGPSMEPTLQSGNRLVISKYIYRFRAPERGEVIVFTSNKAEADEKPLQEFLSLFPYGPENPRKDFVKRVIGVPGDKVAVKAGIVYVNGVAQKEDYIKKELVGHVYPKEAMQQVMKQFDEYPERLVPEGTVFVLGDNRYNSLDSRDFRVGFVSMDVIKGKALMVFWPFSNWKTLP